MTIFTFHAWWGIVIPSAICLFLLAITFIINFSPIIIYTNCITFISLLKNS